MRRRAEKACAKQAANSRREAHGVQLVLPTLVGLSALKDLTSWVHEVGLAAVAELLEQEATELAGPKGRHEPDRAAYRWGSTATSVPLCGRKVRIRRPRLRSKDGRELSLPSLEQIRRVDPLSERVVNQILLGVSSRDYAASLEPLPSTMAGHGTSKSSVSRRLRVKAEAKLKEQIGRRLDGLELVALMVDGIYIGGQVVVVALGISPRGDKLPLGLWLGSTENATVCTALLQNLLERGLRVEHPILCIIDGGKGIRRALDEVLGTRALIQRCQLHKRRNVLDHLPARRTEAVKSQLCEAYQSRTAELARRRLRQLVSWLECNGHDGAAASLREGLEETLTVLKLQLPETLRRSLSTTNAIENVMSTFRRITGGVTRWRKNGMVRRWMALGIAVAEARFRRIRGARDLPGLLDKLNALEPHIDVQVQSA
jgi:putative transposase